MQYQVPQFIETEDKVVGPFSLRQFAYVGAACFVTAIAYFLVATWLFVIIAIIFIGGALALSFIKINGRPLPKIVLSAAGFYWKPQMYIWKPEHPVQNMRPTAPVVRDIAPIAAIASGEKLHKSWQNLQTGTPPPEAAKKSDRQFLEKKMNERYQIFQRPAGDRQAAKRVDYR